MDRPIDPARERRILIVATIIGIIVMTVVLLHDWCTAPAPPGVTTESTEATER